MAPATPPATPAATASAGASTSTTTTTNGSGAPLRYCDDLRAPLTTAVGPQPHAPMHQVEWRKVMAGDPVEINPSIGNGFKVMSVEEWSRRWKRNDDFPHCLAPGCGGADTREHYFTQTWCRGKRLWASESLCMACHAFSFRSYADPDFKTPEQYEKELWEEMAAAGRR
ncbi:hypothetical protein CHLRE_07g350926v5 [Chlamydomonas reinhardtii]|uniref:Uncharacterized protein n=1 Tax=Chlamydomonas reinhardtii TaxID=3055 RepID=A8IU77_CHLRE|nr:uncharacterized protein CHLRE_07g350926v5 [Chlamydomonas reinhardtii]PNW81318.1 hypothetical protein CHLRE_07g350926v5 [Chlamydomonas reinhardtii]|eukprot:XP_001692602.1 hypothetical protein CHLREDRAFT_146129 [Chlamydomonas reinhardtii]